MDFENLLKAESNEKPKKSKLGLAIGVAIGGLGVGLSIASFPFILPFFRRVCLPYVPATTQQVANVLEALNGRSGKLVDLGSGDGRIVFAAAKNGFDAVGIELNPWLVLYSKIASLYQGIHRTSKFQVCDLWNFNLKPYKNVVIFGVESMMNDLEEKFMKELEKETHIVVCRFPLPNLKPIRSVGCGIDTVWIYVR